MRAPRDRLVDVAHDRASDHLSAAGADALQEARADERLDRRGEHCGDRGEDEDREPGEQHGAPPEAVGERAVGELRDPEPDHQRRQRELRLRVVRAEVAPERGQGREVQVARDREQREQSGDEDDERLAGRARRVADQPHAPRDAVELLSLIRRAVESRFPDAPMSPSATTLERDTDFRQGPFKGAGGMCRPNLDIYAAYCTTRCSIAPKMDRPSASRISISMRSPNLR